MAKIAFDIDDTLYKIRRHIKHPDQVPDYDLIAVLRWFYNNGDEVYVWSAGGIDYAETICRKLGIDEYVTIVPKQAIEYDSEDKSVPLMDIAFDDEEIARAKVNIKVNRSL